MDISFDPTEIVGAIIGLIGLLLVLGLVNLLLSAGNRLVRGGERIDKIVLLTKLDTLRKYVPQAINSPSSGNSAVTINFVPVLQKLFHHAIDDAKAKKWATSGKMSVMFFTDTNDNSAEAAAGTVIHTLRMQGFSGDSKARVYTISSTGTDKDLTAYLVIIGNIPKSAPRLDLSFGED